MVQRSECSGVWIPGEFEEAKDVLFFSIDFFSWASFFFPFFLSFDFCVPAYGGLMRLRIENHAGIVLCHSFPLLVEHCYKSIIMPGKI